MGGCIGRPGVYSGWVGGLGTWPGTRLVKATAKRRRVYPSVVLASTWASIRVCHFLIRELIFSRVRSMPWKLVRISVP